jgi:Zn-finger nucleic acid-binding protein
MQAETLNCPMCGAAAATDSAQCQFCGARLATVACPSCFGMMFLGSKHCPHCGARASRAAEAQVANALSCPRCRALMESVVVGPTTLRECAECGGLWVDVESFEKICADREQQAAVLGSASVVPKGAVDASREGRVRYVPCPQCKQLMNRVNFARCSGVVVDVCKGHGTWFDRDELRQIVEFIRGGGLVASRAKEKMQLEEERRRLKQERLAAANAEHDSPFEFEDQRPGAISAARGLLKILLD